MVKYENIQPYERELPSSYAARLGEYYSSSKSTIKDKKEKGQFFTPIPIADLMVSLNSFSRKKLDILDPGCGTCILSTRLIENLSMSPNVKDVNLLVYETDLLLIPYTNNVLSYLRVWLKSKKIILKYTINTNDFILENARSLRDYQYQEKFDIIISNPPYFKLSKDDPRVISCKELVDGQPNIYALFLGLSVKLLKTRGEIISINPKSFTSGRYFKEFRVSFLETMKVEHIHLFTSRTATFKEDNVLQETIILKAVKIKAKSKDRIIITSSNGVFDEATKTKRILISYEDFVNLTSSNKIIHIPSSTKELNVVKLVNSWESRLEDLYVRISTGPVVSFRANDYIKKEKKGLDYVPLFWLQNVSKMSLNWPLNNLDKGQYIKCIPSSQSLLIPNKNYIFLRRMSSKDDSSRLIAAPYLCNYTTAHFIGVENKLNYLYRKDGHMDRYETVGLCAILNSTLFDTYFQIINGNINVSATELREMRVPSLLIIKEIGKKIILKNDYSMSIVNELVSSYFIENKIN